VRPTRPDAFAQGPGFIVADNAAGLAALIGPEVPLAALAEPAALRAALSAGDATTAGAADAVLGDPLRALAWLASALGELPAGTVVLTGAMARAIPAPPGAALLLDCGAWGRAWARVF
jgi:2-keto-4-pentenoate hydratase